MNKDKNKIYSTVAETAEIMGVSNAYVRELLNRAKVDSSIKLRGRKVGKEWRIDTNSISEYLGIDEDIYKQDKEIYIRELEAKVKAYEIKIQSFKSVLESLNKVVLL